MFTMQNRVMLDYVGLLRYWAPPLTSRQAQLLPLGVRGLLA